MNYLNVLAKALYDNVAESPDELSFRKGDIMTVLERDTQGLDGWWLCSLHGRQGIVPGNRLKILVGMHDKKPAGPGPGPPAPSAPPQPGLHNPATQYTSMLPTSYPPQPDSVYLVPTPSKTQQGLYQAPGPSPQFQSPPAKQTSTFLKQMPHHPFPSPAPDLYQVPPGPGSPAQDIYQVPPSAGIGHDIYQVPPSMDARSWEGTKPPAKVVVPTRMGQGYVFEASQPEQDEYDIPRHLLGPGPQDIYDVPPVRGLLPSQYSQEVYDTPPMAVKGPNGRDPSLDVYDVPPSVEKGLPPSSHRAVYDVPPSVSKDMPDGPLLREETYDVPPAFAKAKPFDPARHPLVLAAPPPDSPPAEDVYDVPPPAPDLYDVPPGPVGSCLRTSDQRDGWRGRSKPPCARSPRVGWHRHGHRQPQLHPGLVPQTVQGPVHIYDGAGCGTIDASSEEPKPSPVAEAKERPVVLPACAAGLGRVGGQARAMRAPRPVRPRVAPEPPQVRRSRACSFSARGENPKQLFFIIDFPII
uniref:BCAR1 scaffold protein, Cas family member n=1 Tax=Rousettus aegyptiacus TaxID=9407 RepID=A0A7J8CE65_ROUAE|nr:BCAR1 scaffold protein, Cas family member [Rousettus aegyptiacus]